MSCILWLATIGATHAAEDFAGRRFYLGDVHSHTGASRDGGSSDMAGTCDSEECAALSDYLAIAHENGLDFVAVTDHTNARHAATDEAFAQARDTVLAGQDQAGGFLTLLGAEIWFELEGSEGERIELGHRTLILFGDDAVQASFEVTDGMPTGTSDDVVESCAAVWGYAADLEARFGELVLFAHHPAAYRPMATMWDCHDDHFEPVVEIYSEHGSSDLIVPDYDPLWSQTVETGTVEHAMDPTGFAHRLGFVGGTDSHDTRPGSVCRTDPEHEDHPYGGGLTVAVLDATDGFTRRSLYGSFRDRRTYATSGPLLPATFSVSSGGAHLADMGEIAGLPPGQPLVVSVTVPSEADPFIDEVRLVGPGAEMIATTSAGDGLFSVELVAADVPAWLYAEVIFDGLAYTTQEKCEDGGTESEERLWLSPIFIEAGEPDLDGDGVAFLDGDCDDGDAAVHPGAEERCTGGMDDDCDGWIDDDDPDCTTDTGRTDTDPADTDPIDTQPTDGPPTDSAAPNSPADGAEPGCGCTAGATGWATGGLWWLIAGLAVRRRR